MLVQSCTHECMHFFYSFEWAGVFDSLSVCSLSNSFIGFPGKESDCSEFFALSFSRLSFNRKMDPWSYIRNATSRSRSWQAKDYLKILRCKHVYPAKHFHLHLCAIQSVSKYIFNTTVDNEELLFSSSVQNACVCTYVRKCIINLHSALTVKLTRVPP